LTAGLVNHQQVLAKIVKEVDVMSWYRRTQPRAHFPGENVVTQTLGGPHFVLVLGPGHPNHGSLLRNGLNDGLSRAAKGAGCILHRC
jgi:hypothetical protein